MVDNTTARLAEAVEAVFGRAPEHGIRIVEQRSRLYSSVWLVELSDVLSSRRVIIKSWPSDQAFRDQQQTFARAKMVFDGRDDICIPYIGSYPEQRLMIMAYVDDSSLLQLARLPAPLSSGFNLRLWRSNIDNACFAAGRWLREWHESSMAYESLDGPLLEYINTRKEELALLEKTTRQRLIACIGQLGTEQTNAIHGDFTPPNVLWSNDKLTILDFGISEWRQMSPWWDYVAMEIGLMREFKFSLKSPAKWLPKLGQAALDKYRLGYGLPDTSSKTHWICAAIRHLVLYGTDIRAGNKVQKRAAWHKQQLHKALSLAEAT